MGPMPETKSKNETMKVPESHFIELQQLGIGYAKSTSGVCVLADLLSMKVKAGEIIALIGRNGCGKSTLLRTIARMQLPLKGAVLIGGRDIKSIARLEFAKILSFVSTEIVDVPHMKVSELVSLGRFPYTNWIGSFSGPDRAAVNSAIELAGIGSLRNKMLYELSDGERQKTMIARALAQDTRIIVLDEPTAFLDLPNRYELLRLLNKLAHQMGKTVLYSTHDLSIALHESDKLWLMASGNVNEGAPEDLIITKGFHKLFENSDLYFDRNAADFRLQRKYTGSIKVSGDPELILWTSRALERIGIKIREEDTGSGHIVAGYQEGSPVWSLNFREQLKTFSSVYDLISFIKFTQIQN
jgi:cobalamin transport system ATP-binding protein